jgi:hypothetical protein
MGSLFATILFFILKHKSGTQNKVADALSRRSLLLSTMQVQVVGFNSFKDLYSTEPYFEQIYKEVSNSKSRHIIEHSSKNYWNIPISKLYVIE